MVGPAAAPLPLYGQDYERGDAVTASFLDAAGKRRLTEEIDAVVTDKPA